MIRLFTMASILAFAADLARPGGAPMPVSFNPLGTTISPRQGSGAGGY